MAEQVRDIGQAGQAAAQPVIEMMVEWGRVYLRITDVWLARGLAIGAFYLANRYLTMRAVRRAVERRDPDNPDQPADPQVGLEAEVDSLLVPVIFYSKLGYQYFTSILNSPFLKACLQTELEKVGYKELIDVCVEKWDLPNLPEGEAGPMKGMMGVEKVKDWLAAAELHVPERSTEAGDSGIPEDASSTETRDSGTSEDVSSEATEVLESGLAQLTSELTEALEQAELPEGLLKRWRALLLKHKDSPTAETWLEACICLERGAAMLTSGGYQEGEGVEHLLEGLAAIEYTHPTLVTTTLYYPVGLHLDKPRLDQLITAQLQANPNSTPCLLMQALQLPEGHSRQQALNHVIDIVLQHGEEDPMYKHLAYMYCTLGNTFWVTTRQPAQALSAFASALMHKSDHLSTLYFTAEHSMNVSVPQAIRQFHHYIQTAPTDHEAVPWAHYRLVTLYGQQDLSVHWDRILHHHDKAHQSDENRLPMFAPYPVPSSIKQEANKVFERVMRIDFDLDNACKTS